MSTLRTYNLQNPDSSNVNIELTQGSGAVVAGVATFSSNVRVSGNLTVGGVLTYDDVTNIDSVGVITARSGIRVLAGGANIVGATTATSDIYLGNDIYLTDGASGYEKVEIGSNDLRVEGKHIHSQFGVWTRSSSVDNRRNGIDGDNNDLTLYSNSTEKVRITSTGNIGIGTDTPIGNLHLNYNGNNGTSFRMENFEGYSTFHNDGGALYVDSGQHIFRSQNGSSERFRITPEGSALLTTDGQSAQYSYAMKLGQGAYLPNDSTAPHYGLWVRQLGPRYELNYGVYSEVEDDNGFYGGETLDGLSSVRGVGVFGGSPVSSQSYQKSIGVYGKATNESYNYNTVIGVRGRVETGTTTFTANNGQQSFGGHFVATGKSDVIGVYADAYLAGSPGANQEAIPLLVSSNGNERLRVDSSARVIIDGAASGNNKLQIYGTGNDTAFVRLKRTSPASNDSAYGGINVVDNNDVTIGTAEFRNQDSTTRSQFVLKTYNVSSGGLAEALRVKADGKVGINEAAPDRQLHVKSGANSADGAIRIESANDNIMDMGTDGTGHFLNCVSTDPFRIKFAGTEKFRIDNAGRITISGEGVKLNPIISSLYAQEGTLSYYGTNNYVYLNGAGANGGLRLNAAGTENYQNCVEITGSNAGAFIMFRSQNNERLRIANSVAAAIHVKGESALTGTTGDAKGLSIAVNGGASCPLYFGTETHSAQKSMYLSGYWIYLRGHQNEGIRFVFSQGSGNAPRSDQYQFKYNQATRPTGNTTWDGFSDRRAKENVQDVTSALDTIGRLRPVTFDWTNDYADRMNMFNMDKTDPKSYNWFSVKENGYDETRKNNNVGFIAQEFEEVFPKDITETEMQLGDETITDFKTVNFDSLVPMLTKAVQELKAENDSLKARLDAAGL